jgi:hypothetical protein
MFAHRYARFEIRTAVGPFRALQCVLSGGQYTVASHARHDHVVSVAVAEAGDMADEDVVRAEEVAVRAP